MVDFKKLLNERRKQKMTTDNYSTTATAKSGGFDREPISEGLHAAKCIGIFGIGTHKNDYLGTVKEQTQVVLMFAVDETFENDKKETVNKTISRFYTLSLSKKANLRKDLEKWRGKEFTAEELEGFDVSKVLGATCLLDISNHDKDGTIKDKIDSVTKINKKFIEDVPNVEPLTDAPEWIKELRKKSIEATGNTSDSEPSKAADNQQEQMEEEYSETDLPF